MIWKGTAIGVFSVKSAYHLKLQRRSRSKGECSHAKVDEGVWKGLLKLHALAVVKNFMWRVCHNLLPTKGNLFSRNIVPDPLCTICLQEPKTFIILCGNALPLWGCGKRAIKSYRSASYYEG